MYFTFNNNYKDILELTNEVVEMKRRLVAQVDPHLKAISRYNVYKEANDRRFLIMNDNEPFQGKVSGLIFTILMQDFGGLKDLIIRCT